MSALFDKIKKRRITSALSILLLVFPVFMYIISAGEKANTASVYGEGCVLVIDAGHGGIDCGALAADGSRESDINLAIALKLRAMAELFGQPNTMTRQDDSTMSDLPSYSEQRDLERRAEIVNSLPDCVYVSIHQNFFPTGQPNGSQVIYASCERSESFGKLTHENLVTSLNPENRRLAVPAKDKYYVLANVECPAILVECGFMSNFSEMELLKKPEYQTSLATVLMASFLQYTQNTRYI